MCGVPSPNSPPVKIRAICFFDASPRTGAPSTNVHGRFAGESSGSDSGAAGGAA